MSYMTMKMCPLHTGHTNREYRSCDKEWCAWWDGDMCAVARIARWYRDIEDDVYRMDDEYDSFWDQSGVSNR